MGINSNSDGGCLIPLIYLRPEIVIGSMKMVLHLIKMSSRIKQERDRSTSLFHYCV